MYIFTRHLYHARTGGILLLLMLPVLILTVFYGEGLSLRNYLELWLLNGAMAASTYTLMFSSNYRHARRKE